MMVVRGLLLLTSAIKLGQVAAAEMPQVLTSMPQEARAARTASKEDVAYLNRHIFAGNVLKPLGGGVEQWVVSFCPRWWQPCQQLEQTFLEAARNWQSELNTDPSMLRLRFAQVDCAVDKVLCNEEHVTTYPMVALYRGGIQIDLKGIAREQTLTALEQFLKTNVQRVPRSEGTEGYGKPSFLEALGKLPGSPLGQAHLPWTLEMLVLCWQNSCDLLLAAALLLVSLRFLHYSPEDPRGNYSTRITGHSSVSFLPWGPSPAVVEI
ncbi:desi2 [Symbiodinium sp. CCMP2592]|nr:desi2 [Symbiodinium sp. CCMP2592]CAE7620026.1 desi2 [Symbiodinium sp. CCMP2592]